MAVPHQESAPVSGGDCEFGFLGRLAIPVVAAGAARPGIVTSRLTAEAKSESRLTARSLAGGLLGQTTGAACDVLPHERQPDPVLAPADI